MPGVLGQEEAIRERGLVVEEVCLHVGGNRRRDGTDAVRRLYIAMMQSRYSHSPRNGRLYDSPGKARHYSARRVVVDGEEVYNHESGYVLMVDIDTLPRVVFDPKGKAVGIAKEGKKPSLTQEHEEAERMVEVWAKRAMELNRRIQAGEV